MRTKYKKKKNSLKYFYITAFILFLAALAMTVLGLEKKFMNVVIAVSDMQLRTKVNEVIDKSVSDIILDSGLLAKDFITSDISDTSAFSTNTVLINSICSKLAVQISTDLLQIEKEKIKVPVGAVMGVDILANFGPSVTYNLRPSGTAEVDYETAFVSAGINQIHFQVFLNIKTNVKVINPLHSKEIDITRKISLVDTVISGSVPQNFFGVR